MKKKWLVLFAVVLGVAYFKDDIANLRNNFRINIAEYPEPDKTVWPKQENVSKDQLGWYYHADQGTRTFGIPYEWFVALEQPTIPWLLFNRAEPFITPAYLDRYGFIADPTKPDGLPIGFARGLAMTDGTGTPWRNPQTKADMTGVGLTCAACHTGRFTYRDTAVIVDGGPALINLYELKKGLGLSLVMTRYWPFRFARFADAVLGEHSTVDDRMTLRDQLDQVISAYKDIKDLEEAVAGDSVLEGYGRLDALNRIGNQVFGIDLKNRGNYAAHSAPVHYPRIWNAPWFDWVQYNGSIQQPMVRNAGESLGVSSELNLLEPSAGLYKSSARVDQLHKMERMLAGEPPTEKGFGGLGSPKWPEEVLPKIDRKLSDEGAKLYVTHCQECHLPPVGSKEFFENKKWWTQNSAGQPLLKLELIPLDHIGTDPAQATDMANRTVALPAYLGIEKSDFGSALGLLVDKVVTYRYDRWQPPMTAADREQMNGYVPNGIRAPLAYKVRPLNGIWATPPYLHNGSVPTIDALLGPADKRPATFYLGNREYNPRKLGYETETAMKNSFKFDTTIRGNSNRGHEFSNQKGPGVIGDELDENKRKALIEYIKTL